MRRKNGRLGYCSIYNSYDLWYILNICRYFSLQYFHYRIIKICCKKNLNCHSACPGLYVPPDSRHKPGHGNRVGVGFHARRDLHPAHPSPSQAARLPLLPYPLQGILWVIWGNCLPIRKFRLKYWSNQNFFCLKNTSSPCFVGKTAYVQVQYIYVQYVPTGYPVHIRSKIQFIDPWGPYSVWWAVVLCSTLKFSCYLKRVFPFLPR